MAGLTQSLAAEILDGLGGRFSQSRRILRLTTPLGDQALLAECMRGEEEISRGFRFEVAALSLDAYIPLKALIGQPVLLELLTSESPETLRPFHGHITAAELKGANGGFARYHLTIEPWTSFLVLNRDSRIFQNKTVFDILDTVFEAYQGKGQLAPAWRFDIRDRSVYPQRSITTQYQESDLAFAARLMSEEGLFYFFEHAGDVTSSSFGSHTLVIADHNGAFVPNTQPDVRYTQPGAVMHEDSLDRWRTELRLQTNAIELGSWDYRACQFQTVSSAAQGRDTLTSRDVPGAYVFPTREQGQRIADNQLQALQARKEVHIGAGTVRSFAPGTAFTLHDHAKYDGGDDANFTIVRVRHLAHNNLNADTDNALTRLLGQCSLKEANRTDLASSLHATGSGVGERPVYRNRIDAIRSSVPYRSSRTDQHGDLLHPRPRIAGQQTAIVVGPAGSVIHTDRDHRIKVQFHWQRGEASHSRLEHPSPAGHTGAPANDQAGIWIRVATPLAPVAGANWGSHALPRVGQEVLVDFFEGDIDRPVVIGTLYNGMGQGDAQHNQVAQGTGASTGNAPMWFPGESGGHAHPATLSGIKSQSMEASQTGAGAFSQLVFDDTPNQARIALQRHANPHQGTAELNLGHLRHQTDNQRLAPTGFGVELKTEHSAALRAGRGMLLTTDEASAGAAQLDSRPAASQIEQTAQMHAALASTAQKHNARLPGEEQPENLPVMRDLQRSLEVVQTSDNGRSPAGGGQGGATAYAAPHMQLSTPAGIAAATPASAMFSAGSSTVIGAGQDINFGATGGWFQSVKSGISLFTYGKASNANKPGKETGIRLHAAFGKVSSQSQEGETRLTADKSITVASVTKSVSVGARDHVLLTAQGAYIKLSGGNIEVHGPGKIEFKATMKELAGPQANHFVGHEFPTSALKPNRFVIERRYHDDEPLAGAQFEVRFPDGSKRSGTLDGAGRATLDDVPPGAAEVLFGPMPGKYERKDQTPTPNHNPTPSAADIDRLIDKYAPKKSEDE
jgi:type VI secretion system VgrG family protein